MIVKQKKQIERFPFYLLCKMNAAYFLLIVGQFQFIQDIEHKA